MSKPKTVLPVDFFDLMNHIGGLKAEVQRYKGLYELAVKGRADFRNTLRTERNRQQQGHD